MHLEVPYHVVPTTTLYTLALVCCLDIHHDALGHMIILVIIIIMIIASLLISG